MIPLLDIGIIEAAPLLMAAVRSRVSVAMISDAIANSPVWERMRERGIKHGDQSVVIYWGEAEGEVTLDIGVEVTEPFRGDEDLQCVAAPSGRAVTATHTGNPHLLPRVHERVRAWSREGERRLSGVNWEVYDHTSSDSTERKTRVYYLLHEPKSQLPSRKKWSRFSERPRRPA